MPYQVVCPSCSAKLKSSQPVPAGRSLTCPQCKKAFTLTEAAPEIDAQPVPTPPQVAAASGREVATPRKGTRAELNDIESADIVDAADFDVSPRSKAKSRRDDDDDDRPRSRSRRDEDDDDRRRSRSSRDDDDLPRSKRRRDDDDDERPRSRRNRDEDDEEDDRPRKSSVRNRDDEDDRPRRGRAVADEDDSPKSKRRRDEDEDDLPKSKRRQDEDEDDLPKSKRRRDEDDEDEADDRPRSRGKKGKKKNKALLLALIGGVAALLFLCGGGAFMYFVDPFGIFGGGSSEMLAWAPADSQMIIYMDVEGIEKIDEMKSTVGGQLSDSTKLGLKSEDVSAVMGAGKGGGFMGPGDPDVTIIKLRKSADQKKIIDSAGGKEATASGKKYYKTSSGGGLHFASDKLVVVTKSESTMTTLLQKDEGKIAISDDLRAMTKRGDGVMWVASTGPAAEKGDILGMMAGFGNMFKEFGAGGKKGAAPSTPPKCKSTLMAVKVSGNKATNRLESTYDSSDAAKRIADDLKKMLDLSKGKTDGMESFDVSTSGATVTLTMVGPVNKSKGGFPGLPIGGAK